MPLHVKTAVRSTLVVVLVLDGEQCFSNNGMFTGVSVWVSRACPRVVLYRRGKALSAIRPISSDSYKRCEACMAIHVHPTMAAGELPIDAARSARLTSTDPQNASPQHASLRLAKRKVAIFVAYVGSAFRGIHPVCRLCRSANMQTQQAEPCA